MAQEIQKNYWYMWLLELALLLFCYIARSPHLHNTHWILHCSTSNVDKKWKNIFLFFQHSTSIAKWAFEIKWHIAFAEIRSNNKKSCIYIKSINHIVDIYKAYTPANLYLKEGMNEWTRRIKKVYKLCRVDIAKNPYANHHIITYSIF